MQAYLEIIQHFIVAMLRNDKDLMAAYAFDLSGKVANDDAWQLPSYDLGYKAAAALGKILGMTEWQKTVPTRRSE